MKNITLMLCLTCINIFAQQINGIQLFNPDTNDETPIISPDQQLILKFDDLSNSSTIYRYTIKHLDRNWQDDGLFFTEYAKGTPYGLVDNLQYSFNTLQKYTHYELTFPNEKIYPIISGNFEIIIYKNSPEKPIIKKRFCIVENKNSILINISRFFDKNNPKINQRIEIQANAPSLSANISTISLSIIQNNNWNNSLTNLKPSSVTGSNILFQQPKLAFAGNNEFFFFDNKNINQPYDMIANTEILNEENHTYLFPVWVNLSDYLYQPDVNGAFYFRRNDMGTERNADREADYSWVHFTLPIQPMEKNIFVLGQFNDYTPSPEYQMYYNEKSKAYEAKIYLKQGFYNYLFALQDHDTIDFNKINGNFWQTKNLYQALLYYRPFGKNYDAILSYGELRNTP